MTSNVPRLLFILALCVFGRPSEARASPTETPHFRDCVSCPEMVRVPAGSFIIGAPRSDPASDDLERPQTRVTIKAFWLGKYPVTRGEYAVFARATKRRPSPGCSWTGRAKSDPDKVSTWQDTGFPQSDRSPVVCVSWDDVNAYVAWLRTKTGKPYRLPSEAEWEYAARAGSTTAFPWGDAATRKRIMDRTIGVRSPPVGIAGNILRRSALSPRTVSDFTTCTEMSSNMSRTASRPTIRAFPATARLSASLKR
jgi:formylglycine-generating enzyme required for sulfatase activity